MKRALQLVAKGAVSAAFIASVEFFCWRQRRKQGIEKVADRKPPRLRVRHGSDRGRVTFAIEGTLDAFAARMLACSVAQAPQSATMIVDLSAAGPIKGEALTVFARLFAGRQIRLRGVGDAHLGLLALSPAPHLRLAA